MVFASSFHGPPTSRIGEPWRWHGGYARAVQLTDLEAHEQLALTGLIRFLVRIDGEFSPAEVSALTVLSKDIGSALFWQKMSQAQRELESADDVLGVVESVQRREVREWIYGVLMGIAAVEGMKESESELLDWLFTTWEMG